MFDSLKLTGVAGAVAKAMDVEPPYQAEAPLPEIDALVKAKSKSGKAERVIIYNPDAIGFWLYQKYTDKFIPVMTRINITLPMLSVFPPVTPVAFGTMYTGAMPAVHGIESYVKPVIAIDSLFDSMSRAGKRVALVAVSESSMSKIFLKRPIDYFFGKNDQEVETIAQDLIKKDAYDFLVVYNEDYDDSIHATEPESVQSLAALDSQIATFARLSDSVQKYWSSYNTLMGFAPDHGIHKTIMGVGDHFADIPEDMNMIHFWAFYPAKQ